MSNELVESRVIKSTVAVSSAPSASNVQTVQSRDLHLGPFALKRALLTGLPLMVTDLLALLLALAVSSVAIWLVAGPIDGLATVALTLCGSLVVAFALLGLYPSSGINPIVELRQVICGSSLVFVVVLGTLHLQQAIPSMTVLALLVAWPLTLFAIPITRLIARQFLVRFDWWGERALVFGGGRAGTAVYRHLHARPSLGLRPVGIVDELWANEGVCEENFYLGPFAVAAETAESKGVSWAIIAMPERSRQDVLEVVQRYARDFPHLLLVPDMEGLPSLWTGAVECGGLLGLRVNERLLMSVPRLMKRAMDLALIILAAPLLLPIFAIVSLLIKLSSPGPVFYCQERIGFKARRFHAWKFRSMVKNADQVLQSYLASNPEHRAEWERDHKLRNDPRITRIGRLLRKTSLDELPQLWNVIRGEMSLVGPRPIVEAEISKYSDRFELYTKVTPGITGLWQISGRNDTTYAQRVDLDTFYVRNWSPWLDLHILASTIRVVLFQDGAY